MVRGEGGNLVIDFVLRGAATPREPQMSSTVSSYLFAPRFPFDDFVPSDLEVHTTFVTFSISRVTQGPTKIPSSTLWTLSLKYSSTSAIDS